MGDCPGWTAPERGSTRETRVLAGSESAVFVLLDGCRTIKTLGRSPPKGLPPTMSLVLGLGTNS